MRLIFNLFFSITTLVLAILVLAGAATGIFLAWFIIISFVATVVLQAFNRKERY